ncbi:MAG: hypothetical protein HUU20_20760 [Pirellulales bacterium]|nr:hypothetical protein [Pirellulales bacterium]
MTSAKIPAFLWFAIFLAALARVSQAAPPAEPSFVFPTTGVRTSPEAVLLAIDDASLPLKRNLCFYLSKPTVRIDPVLTPNRANPDAPDFLSTHFYGTVLFDQGKYRMWYYACHRGQNPDWSPALKAQAANWKDEIIPGPLCYAESDDGLTWRKPDLGQLLFKGSRHHNALDLPSALTGDACVVKDDDPDPSRRYKLAFWTHHDPWNYPTMRIATSPDGLVWKAAPRPPIRAFLEHASFYRHNGLYIVNSQAFMLGEGGRDRGRQGVAWISPDFDHWLQEPAESFALPAVAQLKRDEVHLGVGAASFGNVAVGLYCIWHNDPDFGKISGDFGLLVSNDGIAFREPVKGHVFLKSTDSPSPAVGDRTYPTILCQANGIVNVGDETRIYHSRWRNAGWPLTGDRVLDYYDEVALATLPRDRWGALGLAPRQTEGSVWSAPVVLPQDCRVELNADGADQMTVEIADERFGLLSDYAEGQSGRPVQGGGLACEVQWPKGSLKPLAGRTVRFRIHMKSAGDKTPRLYAVYLKAAR